MGLARVVPATPSVWWTGAGLAGGAAVLRVGNAVTQPFVGVAVGGGDHAVRLVAVDAWGMRVLARADVVAALGIAFVVCVALARLATRRPSGVERWWIGPLPEHAVVAVGLVALGVVPPVLAHVVGDLLLVGQPGAAPIAWGWGWIALGALSGIASLRAAGRAIRARVDRTPVADRRR